MRMKRLGYALATSAAAIALLAVAATQPAGAQERKSIRWATSSVDSYGYKVAASMVKIVEEALGGEYTVTVNPYPSTTGAMKAAMDGNGEIGYTADIGMTQLYAGEGGFKNYKPAKAEAGAHLVRLSDGIVHGASRPRTPTSIKCWSDFSGKPVFFTTAGFMNWLNFQRIYKALGYEFKHVQIDPKSQCRRAAGRHDRRLGRLHDRRPLARALLEGDRDPHGREGDQSVPG